MNIWYSCRSAPKRVGKNRLNVPTHKNIVAPPCLTHEDLWHPVLFLRVKNQRALLLLPVRSAIVDEARRIALLRLQHQRKESVLLPRALLAAALGCLPTHALHRLFARTALRPATLCSLFCSHCLVYTCLI